VECLGHFHRTRSQAFACAKIASAPKPVVEILRKRAVVINFLRPKYCLENVENGISKHLNFKIFQGGEGGMPQEPHNKLMPSALKK